MSTKNTAEDRLVDTDRSIIVQMEQPLAQRDETFREGFLQNSIDQDILKKGPYYYSAHSD